MTHLCLAGRRRGKGLAAGDVLLAVPQKWHAPWGADTYIGAILVFKLLAMTEFGLFTSPFDGSRLVTAIGLAVVAAIGGAGLAVFRWLARSNRLELCERGILVNGLRYCPWAEVEYYEWEKRRRPQRLRIRCRRMTTHLEIPLSEWRNADSVLAAHVQPRHFRHRGRPERP